MALILWKDSYSTHVKEIDQQHKHLIDLINQLHDAMRQGASQEVCYDTLKELVDYTDYHFKTEEKLFDQLNYPQKAKHKAEHDKLRAQAIDHLTHFKEKPLVNTIEIMHFLGDWLNHHILGNDIQFGEFIKQSYKNK